MPVGVEGMDAAVGATGADAFEKALVVVPEPFLDAIALTRIVDPRSAPERTYCPVELVATAEPQLLPLPSQRKKE